MEFFCVPLPQRYGRSPMGPTATKGQALYVASVPSGCHKIGIAKNPRVRRGELQTGNPELITLVGSTQIDPDGFDARELERRIHSLLGEQHRRGEWFECSFERVALALKCAWLSLKRPGFIERYERRFGSAREFDVGMDKIAEWLRSPMTKPRFGDVVNVPLSEMPARGIGPKTLKSEVHVYDAPAQLKAGGVDMQVGKTKVIKPRAKKGTGIYGFRDADARRPYMKEYMRKRRAAPPKASSEGR